LVLDLEKILALAKKKAEEAEVYVTSYERTRVLFEANQLKQLTTNQGTLVALRLVKNGRIGMATSTDLEEDREGLIRRALDVAQFGATAQFALPALLDYPEVSIHDLEVEEVSMERMVDLGQELVSGAREHAPELVCEARIGKRTSSVRVINSRGGDASFKRSNFGIEMEGILIRGTDMLFVGDRDSSCRVIRDVGEVLREVKRQLEWAKREAAVTGARLPVIFTPDGVSSSLFPALRRGFNGSTVLQGASPLQNKRGEQAFDRRLSLYDDATVPLRPRSRPCDDEGTPTQRTALIEQGVVCNFLYDLQTAGLAKAQSTGNGKRETGIPVPKESAFIVGEGDTPFEDMLRDMKEGLVVDMLMGASQANVLGGDFGGNVLLGYKVENGEIIGRVKNVVLSGNIYTALAKLVAIGKERRWVGGTGCAPALYLSDLAVASRG
jgi:PmbA protein